MANAAANDYDLQVIITAGPEDPPRAVLGLTTALAAAAVEVRVLVFFAMRGAAWASPNGGDHPEVPGFQGVPRLIEMILEAGGRIEVCSSCAANGCPASENARRPLRQGINVSGLASVAARMPSIQTVTF